MPLETMNQSLSGPTGGENTANSSIPKHDRGVVGILGIYGENGAARPGHPDSADDTES